MESRDVAAAHPAAPADRIIGAWLAELDAQLPVGRRTRRKILLEIGDGLSCAVEESTERGRSAQAGARAALVALGDPRTVAAAFAHQLGATAAHRFGAGLVLTGPLVGLSWVAAFATGGLDWSSQVLNVLSSMPQYPLILAVTVPAAMVAVSGSGWVARHVVMPSHVVTAAALVAAVGCIAGDLSLLSVAISRNLFDGPSVLVAAAVAASVARLSAAGWAGRRITRLRTVAN